MNLIIVESPTKARTLSRFLGKGYEVEATMGHILDLPKSPLSVDIEHGFKPDYRVVPRQKKTIANLKKAAKSAETIFLATDPDREGEAISAHVKEVLNSKADSKFKRIVFHEITQQAVEEAIKNPRGLDTNLVDAQVARRVLDRLVGYQLSPLLWKKIRRGLSAGRVQSVAVRLIVEREREIEAFKPVEYWEIGAEVSSKKDNKSAFIVNLAKINDKRAVVSDKARADEIVAELEKANYKVADVIRKEVKKRPYPPFTTSTLSQAGARVFGWSSKKTMTVAQKLYEEGLITYHRTDSTFIAASAVSDAREYIEKQFGKNYVPESPRFYKTRSKSAQEAHEAIRPTDVNSSYEISDKSFEKDGEKLYKMIRDRFLACQMADAVYDQTTIEVEAKYNASLYLLRASGQVEKFDGWRRVMPARQASTGVAGVPKKASDEEELTILPDVAKGDDLDLLQVLAEQKFTQPPARYNEASLIKTMEKLGIGRPSTYAPTISTIQDRNYVEKEEGKFSPTSIGFAVTDFLIANFPGEFDYSFTAQMEEDLDKVATGETKWTERIGQFWEPFSKKLVDVTENAARVKIATESLDRKCPSCSEGELIVRTGRFGKFIACSRFPECKYTEKIIDKIDMKCPDCGEGDVVVKKTKRGKRFFGCTRYPDCKFASWTKPSS